MSFFWAVFVVFGILGCVLLWRNKPSEKLPPGPKGLPIVGNLLDVSRNAPKTFAKWSQEFGDTITVKLGNLRMVVLHDYVTAKSVLNEENFSGREQSSEATRIVRNHGLIRSEGEIWKEHRRFAISTLRDLGMGKNWFENAILGEINELIREFASYAGEAFNPSTHTMLAVSNVISAIIFGRRYEHSDGQFQKMISLFGENIRLLVAMAPLDYFPILQNIPFGRLHRAREEFRVKYNTVKTFVRSMIIARQTGTSRDKSTEVGDYITRFHDKERKRTLANSLSTFTEEQLAYSIRDLFSAGAETSSTTLLWAFVYMIEYPEVQRKVQEEIESSIGSRAVRMEDRVLLKYTDAVTLDVQRLRSVVPLGALRTNFEPAVIDGYHIPARTLVTPNSYAMHRNPKYWSHPDTLYPEHFLDQAGFIKIPKGFLPFGAGKRECLGEPLAKMEIFLFFANILQNFQIKSAENLPSPSSDDCFIGLTRMPLPYKICFVPRP